MYIEIFQILMFDMIEQQFKGSKINLCHLGWSWGCIEA